MGFGARFLGAATALVVAATVGIAAPVVTQTANATVTPAASAISTKAAPDRASCRRLSVRQRTILRKALHGQRLTPGRCARYRPIVKAAQLRNARLHAARLRAAQLSAKRKASTPSVTTVFGMSANGETALREAETKIGLKAGVVGVFADFKHSFPTADAQNAAARGAALLISWEPWDWEVKSQTQPTYALDRITAGDHDAYIQQFARDAAATGRPVFVRFAAEMNGDWHVWSTGFNGNDPGDYAAAYRHVVDVARAAGGTNIKWMFNPIISYEGSTPLSQLYPGSSYVDWVGLDGYNWGALKWGWQSYTDIFTMGLSEIKAVAPGKPLAIAEIGCVPGTQKPAWVTDSFAKAQASGVRMLVWFEHNKESDWRLSSVSTVARAAKTAATQPGWVAGGDYNKVKTALGI